MSFLFFFYRNMNRHVSKYIRFEMISYGTAAASLSRAIVPVYGMENNT